MKPENVGSNLKIRIDWSELDYFGHVNNVMFFKYIQASRVNYWQLIGLRQHHLEEKQGPMLASCQCDFKKPLFFPGEVEVFCRTVALGNSSFSFEHQLFNHKNELCAVARDVMVMFDFQENRKMAVPLWLRTKIENLEGRPF